MGRSEPITPGGRVVVALFGLVIVGVSIMCFSGSTQDEDAAGVECGSQVMETEDTCITWVDGVSTERSLTEQEEQNGRENRGTVITAVLGMVVGAVVFFLSFVPDQGGGRAVAAPPPPVPTTASPPLGSPPRPAAEPVQTPSKPPQPKPPPPEPPKPPDPARTVSICNTREGAEIAARLTGLVVSERWRPGSGPERREVPLELPWDAIAAFEFVRAGDGPAVLYALRADGRPRERIAAVDLFSPGMWSKLGSAVEEKTGGRLRIDAPKADGPGGRR